MKAVLKLKDILSIGGRISIYRKNGTTNSIALSKLLKKEKIELEGNEYLVYLTYSQTPQIQAIYIVRDPNDGNCELEEIYNKLNDI